MLRSGRRAVGERLGERLVAVVVVRHGHAGRHDDDGRRHLRHYRRHRHHRRRLFRLEAPLAARQSSVPTWHHLTGY